MYPVSRNNTHHDVTDFVNHGMVKNAKLEYLENGTQPFHEIKNLNLCFRCNVLSSYRFVAELILIFVRNILPWTSAALKSS